MSGLKDVWIAHEALTELPKKIGASSDVVGYMKFYLKGTAIIHLVSSNKEIDTEYSKIIPFMNKVVIFF